MPIFGTSVTGSGSTGAVSWIPLATVPVGSKIWLGLARYAAPDKAITFELRTNLTGLTAGSDAATKILYSAAMSPKSGTKTFDLYRNGRLYTVTVVGTVAGEKLWLALKSKSGAAGSYIYTINYTLE